MSRILDYPKIFDRKTKSCVSYTNKDVSYFTKSIEMIVRTNLGSFLSDCTYGSEVTNYLFSNQSTDFLIDKLIEPIRINVPELSSITRENINIEYDVENQTIIVNIVNTNFLDITVSITIGGV